MPFRDNNYSFFFGTACPRFRNVDFVVRTRFFWMVPRLGCFFFYHFLFRCCTSCFRHNLSRQKNKGTTMSQSIYDQIIGQTHTIDGHVGGSIHVDQAGVTKTRYLGHDGTPTRFIVEPSPVRGNRPMVTFRVDATNLFLTQNPYGDEAQAQLGRALEAANLPLPVELIGPIVEFASPPGTRQDNFEGEGFDYTPMRATEGPPGMLQSFCLEGESLQDVGILSPFGKYWRSEHWAHTVSQSSHQLRDETWAFRAAQVPQGQPNRRPRLRNMRRRGGS